MVVYTVYVYIFEKRVLNLKKIELAVIFGGMSSEHDISLLSATSILSNIDKEKYNITKIGITRQGGWLLYTGDNASIADNTWFTKECVQCVISPDTTTQGVIFNLDGSYKTKKIDVIFPVLHGKNGEDGTIQGLFDLSGIPYVGCGVLGSSICMDKAIANQIMDSNQIPRCAWDFLIKSDFEDFENLEPKWAEKLGYPIFVKPANAGSSIGINKATDKKELKASIEHAFLHDNKVVLERFVQGQEVECAVIGNDVVESTLPGEILASKDFYDYEDKYIKGTSKTQIPANLSDEMLEKVRMLAVKSYKALCCTGLSRVDFFIEKSTGEVLLNEINTLPGFTAISMYPELMMSTGLSYDGLIDQLITLAMSK